MNNSILEELQLFVHATDIDKSVLPAYINLEDSAWLDFSLNLGSHPKLGDAFRSFCKCLIEELFPSGRSIYKKGKRLKEVGVIVSNLIKAAVLDKTLRINLNKNFYRHNGWGISFRGVYAIYSELKAAGYIQTKNGFLNRYSGHGKQTRIWVSYSFREKLDRHFHIMGSVRQDDFRHTGNSTISKLETALVQLRDKDKMLIPIPMNENIAPMIEFLQKYNSFSSSQLVTQNLFGYNVNSREFSLCTPSGVLNVANPMPEYHLLNGLYNFSAEYPDAFVLEDGHYLSSSTYTGSNYPFKYVSTMTQIVPEGDHKAGNTIPVAPNMPQSTDSANIVRRSKRTSSTATIHSLDNSQSGDPSPTPQHLPVNHSYYITNPNSDGTLFVGKKLDPQLYRVFHRQMNYGGRFYGAVYQNIKSNSRQYLLINGQATVELDYSGFHTRMLYHLAGINFYSDPYKIFTDKLNISNQILRKITKITLNTMLNANSRVKAKEGVKKQLKEDNSIWKLKSSGIGIEDIMNRILEIHEPIKESFFTGIGLQLMKKDSDIAEDIMKYFLNKGILCLCVHDSFIINEQYEHDLSKVMQEAYFHRIGFECILKKNPKNVKLNYNNRSHVPCA